MICPRILPTYSPKLWSNCLRRSLKTIEINTGQDKLNSFKRKVACGPDFQHFVSSSSGGPLDSNQEKLRQLQSSLGLNLDSDVYITNRRKRNDPTPYLDSNVLDGEGRKVYIETYGCQMNVNDTQIASKILEDHNYQVVASVDDSPHHIFLMTCSIREGAEQRIFTRLHQLNKMRIHSDSLKSIGLLGCMAERLKTRLLESKNSKVDIICGPDAYRDLPKLIAVNRLSGMNAVNVLLSLDETYPDVIPSFQSSLTKSAFVSIMRGCDNFCTYCIVPFTRGKERSRPIESIVEEVKIAVNSNGIKEITLLGQNVNSYRDTTSLDSDASTEVNMSPGFKTIYKPKSGGLTFDRLLDSVARVNPDVRIRFTSPHPKDFPDSVLHVIKNHRNICKCIHLPFQSGSDAVLDRMHRGYTQKSYLDLVTRIKDMFGDDGIAFSTDIICGFCGETEEDHQETLHVVNTVKFNYAYIFAYSMREVCIHL